MRLPSSRSTYMLSSSKLTALAEVLIPGPLDQCSVAPCDFHQPPRHTRIEAETGGNPNLRVAPEFGFTAARAHMHMHQLSRAALVRIEEEAESFVAEHHRRDWIHGTGRAFAPCVFAPCADASGRGSGAWGAPTQGHQDAAKNCGLIVDAGADRRGMLANGRLADSLQRLLQCINSNHFDRDYRYSLVIAFFFVLPTHPRKETACP
jgi:hypothetical protein